VICPECGTEFPKSTGRGMPRRFCRDECRTLWQNGTSMLVNEATRLRRNSKDCLFNARLYSGDTSDRWQAAAVKYAEEAARLDALVTERRGR